MLYVISLVVTNDEHLVWHVLFSVKHVILHVVSSVGYLIMPVDSCVRHVAGRSSSALDV